MKVAVISNRETQLGRSTVMLLLASVFSRSQHKRVSVFSTQEMTDLMKMVYVKESPTAAKSVSVFRALLESASIDDNEIFDYAYRVGEEEVFLFNVFASSIDQSELSSLFLDTLRRVKSSLVLVEVVGDPNTEFNKEVIMRCDAVINVFNPDLKSIEAVKDYVENFDPRVVRRTGYVCDKYNPNIISEKKLAELIKMSRRSIMLMPYNTVVAKETLEGNLNSTAEFIIKGHPELVELRMKLYEIMSFLFDAPGVKSVKEVSEWHN